MAAIEKGAQLRLAILVDDVVFRAENGGPLQAAEDGRRGEDGMDRVVFEGR